MSNVWNKLDTGLSSIYSNYLKVREHGPLSVARVHSAVAGGGKLTVLLDYEGELTEIEALGFRTLAHAAPGLVTGAIDLRDLERLAAHPGVQKMSFGEEPTPDLDVSVPEIRARQSPPFVGVWTVNPSTGVFSGGQTGAGVIIGIIDSGIDFRHPFFLKTSTTTRILRIWDLGLDPHDGIEGPPVGMLTDGVGAAGNTYGVEYTDKHINDVLQGVAGAKLVKHRDCSGHGTHVASIAAGRGSAPFKYVGVAPEADLVIVKLTALQKSPRIIGATMDVDTHSRFRDAVSYILSVAKSFASSPVGLGRPVVINYSLGGNTGPHDGLTLDDDFLTKTFLVSGATGKFFVASAGNSSGHFRAKGPGWPGGRKQQHARIEFPSVGGTIDIPLELFDPRTDRGDTSKCQASPEDTTSQLELNLFYPAVGPRITAAIKPPLVAGPDFQPCPSFGDPTTNSSFLGRSCVCEHGPENTDLKYTGRGKVVRSLVRITIHPVPRSREHLLGTYILRITSPPHFLTKFTAHLWCSQTPKYGFRVALPPYVIPAGVIVEDKFQITNGASGILTVASYDAAAADRKVADTSSRGPLANHGGQPIGVAQPHKPDIGAPGEGVDAAASRDIWPRWIGLTMPLNGTSQAAPHVTGLVALMLQKNPNLTFLAMLLLLSSQARPRQGSETADDIGSGRIDAKKTVDATI